MARKSKSCGSCGQRRCTRSAACVEVTSVREPGSAVTVTYVSQNANGLSYERWYAAATFGARRKPDATDAKLRAAWRAGEDPTDHARALA